MPQFNYTARNNSGQTVTGNIQAPNRAGALDNLTKQNLKPLKITEANPAKRGFSLSLGKGVKPNELVIFTRQLSTMVGAGVPLIQALSSLSEQTDSKALKSALQTVTKDVQSGMSLGEAFGKHPKIFSDIYINMVKAGESGGILDDILKRLAVQQEKSAKIRRKVKGAMIYPSVLIFITLVAFFGLMFFVVPQIGKIIKDLGGEDASLPPLTVFMLGLSDAIRNFWYLIGGGLVGGGFMLRRYLASDGGRKKFHFLILKVPAVGVIVRKVAVARFARTYASLLGAGVSVVEALQVTARAIGNAAYQEALLKSVEEIKTGSTLSASIAKTSIFPAILPQMLAVGEETGKTDEVLIKVADFYEEEVDAAIEGVSSIIEPVMIVVMGGMVGVIAGSVIMPIMQLSQHVQ